jgi:hypothetical protein
VADRGAGGDARGRRTALPPGYYPPTSTGLTGQPDHVISEILKIDGLPNPNDVHSVVGGAGISRKTTNTREVYDCVIVGAGASGLAAAKYYRDRFGQDSKILLLDPCRTSAATRTATSSTSRTRPPVAT